MFGKDEIKKLHAQYKAVTPLQIRVLDIFLAYVVSIGAIVILYSQLISSFPFNSLLSSLMCCLGVFVLTVSLRLKYMSKESFPGNSSHVRATEDYICCNMILFLAVINFIG
mmetsp:Transcript_4898/g.7406  ORF Transcript_4898/g.7406 Transcript_4898/m.7406 type:complete len:111 (+) Transcript_4898:2-334(+)